MTLNGNGDIVMNDAPTDIGSVTMANLAIEKKQEDRLAMQNTLDGNPPVAVIQKIAIVKPMPINYATEAWKQVGPSLTSVGFAAILDGIQRVEEFQFSPWVWNVVYAFVFLAGVGLSLNFALMMHRRKRNNDTVTQLLMEANNVPGATMQLIDCDEQVVNAYRANGYKIVTR
jgi:hypothetical protein